MVFRGGKPTAVKGEQQTARCPRHDEVLHGVPAEDTDHLVDRPVEHFSPLAAAYNPHNHTQLPLTSVAEAHANDSVVAFKLRSELLPKSPALRAAAKAERELFQLRRQLHPLYPFSRAHYHSW